MNGTEMARVAPEVEVTAKASRRRFTVEYKRKIVREADGCKTPGAAGALLRREGLYSSHLTAPARRLEAPVLTCPARSGRISAPNEWQRDAFSALNMLVATGGRERRRDEWESLFASARFALVKTTPIASRFHIIEGRAALTP